MINHLVFVSILHHWLHWIFIIPGRNCISRPWITFRSSIRQHFKTKMTPEYLLYWINNGVYSIAHTCIFSYLHCLCYIREGLNFTGERSSLQSQNAFHKEVLLIAAQKWSGGKIVVMCHVPIQSLLFFPCWGDICISNGCMWIRLLQ